MFIKKFCIPRQSFINIINISNSLFSRKIQRFSFPLHHGLINIKQNDNYFYFNYDKQTSLKGSSNIHELNEGKLLVTIPCQNFECVLTTIKGSSIEIKWDTNDDMKSMVVKNNEPLSDVILCDVNGVLVFKK